MFSAKAVFPIEGRPAMMMKSLDWNPEVMSVELAEPGGEPGDVLLALVEPLDVLEGVLEDGPHREGRALHAPLGDLEDQPLGVVEQLVHVVPAPRSSAR